jgi:hypothetical protein
VLPTVVGFVGDSIAVEANPDEQAEFKTWVDTRLITWEAPTTMPAPVALPVPGMTMQTRLEPCDALEPYLTQSREIELQRLAALAAQQEAELSRLKARIEKGLLDDPDSALPTLKVETVTPAPPP